MHLFRKSRPRPRPRFGCFTVYDPEARAYKFGCNLVVEETLLLHVRDNSKRALEAAHERHHDLGHPPHGKQWVLLERGQILSRCECPGGAVIPTKVGR